MPPHFTQALEIALIGMLVAFVALGAIALLIQLISWIDADGARQKHAVPTSAAHDAAWLSRRPANANIDDLTLVLIVSAATAVLQGRGRVLRVRRLGEATGSWAMKGRVTVQGSHVVTGHYRRRGAR